MKTAFSTKWKASKQPRKQRKYAYNSPSHTASKAIASHLTPDLRKKHGTRSVRVKVGDKVKVMRGQHKGETSRVERIDTSRKKVYLTKIEIIKKDGTKTLMPMVASNLMITELNLEDKRRMKNLKPAGDVKNG